MAIPPFRYALGIIGAGNMAEAIARGLLRASAIESSQMIAADLSAERLSFFESQLHVTTTQDNALAAGQSRLLLLSVKPQQMKQALEGIGPVIHEQTLIVSIAAAIGTGLIEEALGAERKPRVVRAMPNTPMLLGAGMAAICGGKHARADDLAAARAIFEASAKVIEVTEDKMDAVTAVSGSGPAYFFYLAEQMIQAGIDLGLSPEEARALAAQTAVGAARMLSESPDAPAELRRKVTSPGGTTQAAITAMDAGNWPQVTRQAIGRAAARSRELSQ